MVMIRKSAWHKNNRREIKHTIERYLAIMAIIALGVGFFAGLIITKTAMVNTLDSYVSNQKMYDFKLVSTLGLTEDDEKYFSGINGIKAEGSMSVDFIADISDDNEVVLKAHSICDKINLINIKHGQMATAGNECVLDSRFFPEDIIGSKIRVSSNNEEDVLDTFAYDEYTVVGLADSVLYLNYDRGTTSLADGSVYGFVYIPKEGFSSDYFTEVFVRFDDYKKVYSKEYEDLISEKEDYIKNELEKRAELRYRDIVEDAKKEVMDAEKEYSESYDEYLTKKADTTKELDKALEELNKAKREITDKEEKLRDAEKKISEGEGDYKKSYKEYEKALKEYEDKKEAALAELKKQQEELDANRKTVTDAIKQIEESGVIKQYNELTGSIELLNESLSQVPEGSEEYNGILSRLNQVRAAAAQIEATGVLSRYEELKSNLTKIDAGQQELNSAKNKAGKEFENAEKELDNAKAKLNQAKKEIDKNKKDIKAGWEALNEGKAEYEKGLKEYLDGKKEADESFADAEEELSKARKDIDDAWSKINDIEKAKVYVLGRNLNMGYSSFDNDSSIVEGIARVLPIFFFLVAALVCSTTMTRMVDEQRTQIGTLKALGYSDSKVAGKYMFYSGSAATIGCVIGYFLGTKYFPMAIWEAYGMLYGFAPIEYIFDIKLAIISLLVSFLCSAGVTYVSCKTELLQMPAQLIRPKAPKAGKRVLLEYIPLIWNRVGFLHKVSIRNIFRYKRRFFMTVLGIAGCTSLVVAAMGISDSIRNIVNDQFDSIMTYDYSISFAENQNKEEREDFESEFADILSECVFVSSEELEAIQNNKVKRVSVIATDDPDITKVIGLHYKGKTIPYPSFGKAAVSDKLAKDFGLTPGKIITIKINDTETVNVEIESVFENYLYNYLFMTAETYESLFKKEIGYNTAYASTENEEKYQVSAKLSKGGNVINVSVLNDMRIMVDNMMKSLDYIIWLVIICAGALGFVVIYNLNNINITERSREIATIKVLGFFSNETREYVYRESILLTVIGTLLGLGLGKLLHEFIMSQINVEGVSFKVQIFGSSYLIAVLATFTVTILVNLILRKKIEKINMTESLKSVE